MDKRYDPQQIEPKWYAYWTANGLFHDSSANGETPYCIVIPPPNVTGILHMGHALNNIIQDILVRWRKMQGRNVVWMPGTDHAGIATQNVVERALRAEGASREDLGRGAFIERVWQWREEYGNTITRQLRRLGCACDWERERFTMDEGLSDAVTEVFVRLFDKGLIHRANYIINWCPRCHTALSDEESEHRETSGHLYYIRYPLADETGAVLADEYVTVATTRPETLLGDVAVAVNPDDERYATLGKRRIMLPVLGRELTVVRDAFVDPAFGTGIVKVTPAHDPNDFEMGRRHGLKPVNVMNGDGSMNAAAGPYEGMDRFECRKRILADLKEAGLIERVEPHAHAVGQCYRCDTVVEPRLSPQWFVRMKPLAEPALKAVRDGTVRFVPGRWTKVYEEWMENIRDWCISRQIWWGHRIPVFYCESCDHVWAAKGIPESCAKCGASDIRQDEDVLDTWFSSWLWPFSTFGWPKENEDLAFYYPTNDLVTASEIIFFWVARMIMAGYEFMGAPPFDTVYIHGTVRDDSGRKMSKSLGNSIDPLDVIDEFSADALRFSLMMITATGQDVYVSTEKFEIGRNFGTKLWNAARFMQMQLSKDGVDVREGVVDIALMRPDDHHLLARYRRAVEDCAANLEQYRFNDVARELYDFVWHQFCDWYVEYAKEALYGDDVARCRHVLAIMRHVFSGALRLLHPIMPFITEELWHAMGYADEDTSIMLADWPRVEDGMGLAGMTIDPDAAAYVEAKQEMVRLGRALKADYGIATGTKVDYVIVPGGTHAAEQLASDRTALTAALNAGAVEVAADAVTQGMPSAVCELGSIFVRLEGVVDIEAEKARLAGQLDKVDADLSRVEKKLANHDFVTKAPAHVVDRQKSLSKELMGKREKLQHMITVLTGDPA